MADPRINLYHNLSVMLDAGVPITRALQASQKQGRYKHVFKEIEDDLAAGHSLTDAVESRKRKFEKLDRTLIHVGEQTGQTAEMFQMLSEWYAFRNRLNRVIRSGMWLPIMMIHAMAIFVPVVPFALNGFDVSLFLGNMSGILAMFYIPAAVIFGIIFLTPKTGFLRLVLDTFIMGMPLLGKAVRELELSRYSKVFAIAYQAGIPIIEAAKMATDSVGNQVMRRRLYGAFERVKVGDLMTEGFSKSLPAEFINIWEVGEESGDLDDSAGRLGKMHADNAEMSFTAIAEWTPRIVYAIVAGVMVYYIFKGYSQIYGNLSI